MKQNSQTTHLRGKVAKIPEATGLKVWVESAPPAACFSPTSRTDNYKVRNMRISFCTTCFNRLHQFRQTFDHNAAIVSREPDVQWIILNLNSQDGLDEFIRERLPYLPGNIIYALERTNRSWHMCKAKNMAHRLGSGDVLINLDCDNFIGNTLDLIRTPLAQGADVIHLWSGMTGDGTCGRIAIARRLFIKLGGYDESFQPVGYDDLDLLKRALKSGAVVKHRPCARGSALKNDRNETIKYCDLKADMTWNSCDNDNHQKSDDNIARNRLKANVRKAWGKANVKLFHGGKSNA